MGIMYLISPALNTIWYLLLIEMKVDPQVMAWITDYLSTADHNFARVKNVVCGGVILGQLSRLCLIGYFVG